MKLKPCPFCGGTNPTRTWLGHVYCRFCGAEGPIATDGPEVTWNTRRRPKAKKPTRLRVIVSTLATALKPFADEAQQRPWITNLSEKSGLDAHNIGGSLLTNGDLRQAALALKEMEATNAKTV